MPEIKNIIDPIVLRYHGFFEYPALYNLMRGWLFNHRYDFQEKIYKDKPATHFGNEIELSWLAERKETEFIKYKLEFSLIATDNVEVEVVKEGVKKKMNKARLKIKITPVIEYDWQGKYKSDTEKAFLGFLWSKIMKWEFKIKHASRLVGQVHQLSAEIKTFLNMQG